VVGHWKLAKCSPSWNWLLSGDSAQAHPFPDGFAPWGLLVSSETEKIYLFIINATAIAANRALAHKNGKYFPTAVMR